MYEIVITIYISKHIMYAIFVNLKIVYRSMLSYKRSLQEIIIEKVIVRQLHELLDSKNQSQCH